MKSGRLWESLKQCFPETYKQIQSIAYYLILESDSSLLRFEKWSMLHKHPYDKNIPSQRSSDLFSGIAEEQRSKSIKLQERRRSEDEYWAYDTTSLSSYSQTLRQVRYGENKEDDRLPQINLALVFGERSGLPFYYRKLAGVFCKNFLQKVAKSCKLKIQNVALCIFHSFADPDFCSLSRNPGLQANG